jgi:antitoxin HicB
MSRTIDHYAFTVRPLPKEDGGGFLCEFSDVPGIMGDGQTVEAAILDGRKALKATIASLKQIGRSLPEPAKASGQWRMRAPRSLHQRLAARAKAEGVSLNTLALTLLAEGLGKREKDAA